MNPMRCDYCGITWDDKQPGSVCSSCLRELNPAQPSAEPVAWRYENLVTGVVCLLQERSSVFTLGERTYSETPLCACACSPAQPSAEPFVVRHYTADDRPEIKGNGFDGLSIGETRQDAEEFIAWVNARIASPLAQPSAEPAGWFYFDPEDGGEWKHMADTAEDAARFGSLVPLYTHPAAQPSAEPVELRAHLTQFAGYLTTVLPEYGVVDVRFWNGHINAFLAALAAQPSDQEARELQEFIDLAFEAHPNLDLDVAAIRAGFLAKEGK